MQAIRAMIRRQLWTIEIGEVKDDETGFCDHEGERGQPRKIGIKQGQDEGNELDTIIHECLHAGYPDLDEHAVEEMATNLATILLAFGYRKQ